MGRTPIKNHGIMTDMKMIAPRMLANVVISERIESILAIDISSVFSDFEA